ncbi:HIT family protein [Streptomyces sp. TLI_171]|uniref:HIT family protein n=1 Tax=Streptomyces sp. TLI_171 TaxID=1938859 RepID=UPI000C19FB94|nr:HIT family protein [Streptomyces sp. TLI_171]RKE22304.1 histidine triad (HIT) family protein [Streptomyces sp. TLI_171]
MDCLFCRVVAGEVEVDTVYTDGTVHAFLDHRPLFPGHLLVVPRRHVPTLTDLTEEETGPYYSRVRLLTAAVERGTAAAGSFVAANNRISQSVPHLHTHIVPRNPKDGLRGFFWPRTRYRDAAHAAETAAAIRAAI